ncbi:UDP-N-acetylmuramoyl-L-alanine--D-glutamate ligase [Methylobacillus caricis]|uniref:UDP-N-acetylmuramoyl-L-alanine--D-glutamate ligase n=1 Tax=Methylobacillus caricis TaxID=1971611 RepID=UPI001CFFA3AA|nr:UDP-N-acetylmuramoyl-L-alanine--D-glutamate ligase [Methylobacillus caricis]MCB5188587.1 UDP-N-acetylmuramoyl-L-alanine--D-glutamate ligase [Methylobacillus caricis]
MLQLKDKNVLVLGLGDTGLSALRWLKRQGALLSVADTRLVPPGLEILQRELPEVPIYLGSFSQESFAGADVIVASPGVALAEPQIQAAIQQGIPVVGDVELFAQFRSPAAKLIAITGANGKSTVTSLVGEMCRAAGLKTVVAGNIGLPVLDAINDMADVYVLELSSFQLETTHSLVADAATVLNISEDHMDRYSGLRDYAAAKARIFSSLGVQVLNREDSWSKSMALPGRHIISFGTDAPVFDNDFGLVSHAGEQWLAQGQQRLLKMAELKIAGLHNAANALAALALCRALALPYDPLIAALRQFKGLPHRVEWIAEAGDIAFYDDSKGTNVGATCAAIAGLERKVVLIAGGDGKGQDFSPLIGPVSSNARAVVLIGRDAGTIAAALAGTGAELEHAASLEQAVEQAYALAQPGDVVLLSPACASFDMFRNYVHRAQVFVAAVQTLVARESQP